jgi:hypothetical protein
VSDINEDPVDITFTVPRPGRVPSAFRADVLRVIREAVMQAYLDERLDMGRTEEIYRVIPATESRT